MKALNLRQDVSRRDTDSGHEARDLLLEAGWASFGNELGPLRTASATRLPIRFNVSSSGGGGDEHYNGV